VIDMRADTQRAVHALRLKPPPHFQEHAGCFFLIAGVAGVFAEQQGLEGAVIRVAEWRVEQPQVQGRRTQQSEGAAILASIPSGPGLISASGTVESIRTESIEQASLRTRSRQRSR